MMVSNIKERVNVLNCKLFVVLEWLIWFRVNVIVGLSGSLVSRWVIRILIIVNIVNSIIILISII